MKDVRKKFLDYDSRKSPKTNIYCVKCQKDLKNNNFRWIYLIEDCFVVHPDDIKKSNNGEFYRIGNDCAKKLGLEWTVLK